MFNGEELLEDDQPRTPPKYTVDEILDHLISRPETPELSDLFVFSDLSRQAMQAVRTNWPSIPVERRREVMAQLVDAAREDLTLHLGRLLRIAIKDEDAQVRAVAVDGLWEEVAGDLVGDLVHILMHDPDVNVRGAAARTLGAYILAGELEELDASLAMRAESALLDIVESPREPIEVRCRALESVAYSGEVGVRQLIENAYYEPEDELHVSALVAMGRSADIRWRGLVRAELQNPSAEMRAAAAYACGELDASAASAELIEMLADPVQEVRLAVIFALGRIGGEDATDALQTVLLSKGSEDTTAEVEAAEEALEEMAFYASAHSVPLFDESLEDLDEWDFDRWDDWSDIDDSDLGTYE